MIFNKRTYRDKWKIYSKFYLLEYSFCNNQMCDFQLRKSARVWLLVYRIISIHVRNVWPACRFIYSEQVSGTFIPLFSRFISCVHEFRTRWITVTGWKREREEEEEREADVERRLGERGENKGKRPGGIACWPAIKHSSCSAICHILTPGFSLILASYCFILSFSMRRQTGSFCTNTTDFIFVLVVVHDVTS